jgi:hypothetical protein
MTLRARIRPATVILAILLAQTSAALLPAHANTPPPWIVSLDADGTSPTDTSIQTSHNATGAHTIIIGAVINASQTSPVNNVYAWQYSLTYDNTSLTPATVQFGAQTSQGNPDWTSLTAFRNYQVGDANTTQCECNPSNHRKITVYFSLLGQVPGVTIAPTLSLTVQGNLLANVNFTITNLPTSLVTLTVSDVIFLDNTARTIPNIQPGNPITETLTSPSPGQNSGNPLDSIYILLGLTVVIILAIIIVARRRRSKGLVG